ncbi:MAG: DUF6010 family protein [Actinophytocola sp.]|uniref:DUF6010 family protein n=1 Tax=Actinophytocola sp. TaxID=1872138 RepID=UPI003D6B58BA
MLSAVADVVAPVLVGLAYVAVVSLAAEPARQRINAVMVAGAGAAYLSSGALGMAELAFTAAVTFCAYRGLTNYAWLGVGWLLHTGWDIVHHVKGAPIIPELAHSSFGCAICDPVIALWMFLGAPSVWTSLSTRRSATT